MYVLRVPQGERCEWLGTFGNQWEILSHGFQRESTTA